MRRSGIDRGTVRLRGRGDVVWALQAALDLEAAHAQLREIFDEVVRGEVLRTEQVRFLAEVAHLLVDDQLVRQSAGLSALPAVRAAPTERFAGQALAAVADAE